MRALSGRVLSWGDERLLWLALLAVLGTGLIGILGYFAGGGAFLLAGSVLAGAGLTYLSGLPLVLEERFAFGSVIGAMAVCLVAFAGALLLGFSARVVVAALAAVLVAGGAGWWSGRAGLAGEVADLAARARSQWPLWAVLAICWAYTLHLLGQAFIPTAGGIDAGFAGVYGDWAAHLTYAGSFAYGQNFPPQYPVDPGHRMGYPFMVDFYAALLVPLGVSLTSSLVLTSGLLMLAFPAVMYLAGARLLGSRGGAALGVFVFVLGGGLGFWQFFADWARQGPAILRHLPRLYTQDTAQNYQMLNPILAYMIPQRSVLFGFAIALLGTALLWLAMQARGWRAFAFAGVVTGLSPLFHVHGYGTLVALGIFWAVAQRRREWLAFLAPALLLGLPFVLWMVQPGAATLHPLTWWYADFPPHRDGPIWFWIKNTGLFIPLLLVGQFWRGTTGFATWFAPLWLWFAVPNLVVLQPWEWDNTKYFSFWLLFGSLLVGAVLARLFRAGALGAAAGVACFALLTLAGGLDLVHTADSQASASGFIDSGGLAAATWVRGHTDPHAVLLVAHNHNEPVAMLAGRPLVVGYGGWLWTYGLPDWGRKTGDAVTMLRGEAGADALVRRYGVSYVVIGPQESGGEFRASRTYWLAHGRLIYASGNYSVFKTE